MDPGFTGPHENEDLIRLKTRTERTNDRIDDQQSSGGSDTHVPEATGEENDDMIVVNESPSRGILRPTILQPDKNLRPNPKLLTSLMNTDTNQTLQ